MEARNNMQRKQKRVFTFMSGLSLIYWIIYCIQIARGWQHLNQDLQLETTCLAIFSLGLWVELLKEKASGFAMTMACFAFVAATELAFHLF